MLKETKLLVFVKDIDGGTGTFVHSFLKLDNDSIDLKIVCLERPTYRLINKNNFIFLRDKNFYPERYFLSVGNFLNFIQEILWFRRETRKFNPDIVLGVDIHCNLIIQINKLFLRRGYKTILTTHIDLEKTLKDKSSFFSYLLLKNLVTFFYNKADSLVCVSKTLSENLKRDFSLGKKVVTIYNGISASGFIKSHALPRNRKYVLVSLARLTEQKDHVTLIKAFGLTLNDMPNLELQILSNGPLRKDLERMIKEQKLTKKVKILGWVKSTKKYLENAQALVLSSKREGFAYCLIEAMSLGLPVISTDTPFGPREVLGNGKYGILIPVGDIQKLKEGILYLFSDSKRYSNYSEISLERSNFFSEEKMLASYKKIVYILLE